MKTGVWLADRGVALDCFDYPARIYFLSHAHSDHMVGLGPRWDLGPLVCSPVTTAVLERCRRVRRACIRTIKPGEAIDFGGGRAHALDAGHIPGSLMFLLEFPDARILYTGDLKAEPPVVAAARRWRGVDLLYLDATYGEPRYRFPPRQHVAHQVAAMAAGSNAAEIFVALYTLGRLPLVERLTSALGQPIHVSEPIRRAFAAAGLGAWVTGDPSATRLRGYQRGYLEGPFLEHGRFHPDRHLVIVPTGWTLDGRPAHPYFVYVPYSDHSDHAELCAFVEAVAPRRIVPIAGTWKGA